MLEGHRDSEVTEYFRQWVRGMATRTTSVWYVSGRFKEAPAGLMAKAKVARPKELVMVIRYLREEVLVTKIEEDGAALPPCPAATDAAASPSPMVSQIRGLRGALTTLCEAYEARVAELARMGTEAAATRAVTATVPPRDASPTATDSQAADTGTAPAVATAAGEPEEGVPSTKPGDAGTGEGLEEQKQRGGEDEEGEAEKEETASGDGVLVAELPAASSVAVVSRKSGNHTSRHDAAVQCGYGGESIDIRSLVSKSLYLVDCCYPRSSRAVSHEQQYEIATRTANTVRRSRLRLQMYNILRSVFFSLLSCLHYWIVNSTTCRNLLYLQYVAIIESCCFRGRLCSNPPPRVGREDIRGAEHAVIVRWRMRWSK